MDIVKIAVFGIVAAILALTLKRDAPVFALLIGAAAGVVILLSLLPQLAAVLQTLTAVTARLGDGARYMGVVAKIVGIAFVAEFGAHLCADAGEAALAAKVELAGKILVLAAGAPVILAVLEMVTDMTQ